MSPGEPPLSPKFKFAFHICSDSQAAEEVVPPSKESEGLEAGVENRIAMLQGRPQGCRPACTLGKRQHHISIHTTYWQGEAAHSA